MLERGCLPGCKGVDGYLSHAGHHAGCPSSDVVPYPPRDVGLCCYWACFLLGVGTLLPWNALVSAVDIFSFIYPGANVEYTFAVSYTVTLFITTLLLGMVTGGLLGRMYTGYATLGACLLVFCINSAPAPGVSTMMASLAALGDALAQVQWAAGTGGAPRGRCNFKPLFTLRLFTLSYPDAPTPPHPTPTECPL